MWYKAGFGILISVNVLAVLLSWEWWPVSNYPMYAGKRDYTTLAVYRWRVTDKKGTIIDVPFRRLPILSSFSMSLEAMKDAGATQIDQENYIDSYIKSELQILGLKAQNISVYGYHFSSDQNDSCIVQIKDPSLCVKENLVFQKTMDPK